jgi:hypothetical protein
MWTADDISRSLRRYLAAALPEEWTIRLEVREVRDEDRPVAVVELGAISSVRAREAITQGEVESLAPVTITAYPPLPDEPKAGEDPATDPLREARQQAATIASGLERLLVYGLTVTTEPEEGQRVHWAGPFRIPLYDYADVPLSGPEREGPKEPHDVLWVPQESVSVEPIQDTEDRRRWSVAMDFRVSMEAPGRERAEDEGFLAEGIEGSFVPPPG